MPSLNDLIQLRQNFSLQVGQVKEEMTVTADAQMVQTDNTTTGSVIDQKMMFR